jgi:hypothetical protein
MQKPEAKKAVVFLAYSAEWPKKENVNTAGSISAFSRQWKQLELFAIVAPDAVVFLRPEATDVLTTLWKLHVKHIVDIRDVPYLTFDKLDRTSFFDALEDRAIDYVGMHEVMHAEGTDSFVVLMQTKIGSAPSERDRVQEMLAKRIGNGPTAVFCDDDPKQDDKVGVLLDFLAKRDIKHAPLLAVEAH